MNIFVLDFDPKQCARWHVDRHTIKMIVEYTQQLFAAYYASIGIQSNKQANDLGIEIQQLFNGLPRLNENGQVNPYKISHYNHPCTAWVRASQENFDWFLRLAIQLCQEYTHRFNKVHAVLPMLQWMQVNPANLPKNGYTFNALAMPVCFRGDNAIESYRTYYCYKSTIMQFRWKDPTRQPSWLTQDRINFAVETYRIANEVAV